MATAKNEQKQPLFTAVILAGGQASRMGNEDKGLIKIHDKCCIEYVLDTLRPHTQSIIINANRHTEQYQQWGYPVIEDNQGGFLGPLAGIESALIQSKHPLVLMLPCDAPLIQAILITRLLQEMATNKYEACIAHDGDKLQPVFTLLHKNTLPALRQFIQQGGRKTREWLLSLNHKLVDFSDHPEQFFNMNKPEDRDQLKQLITPSKAS